LEDELEEIMKTGWLIISWQKLQEMKNQILAGQKENFQNVAAKASRSPENKHTE